MGVGIAAVASACERWLSYSAGEVFLLGARVGRHERGIGAAAGAAWPGTRWVDVPSPWDRAMKKLACLFLMAALACGGGESPFDLDVGTIRVENHSSDALTEVYISLCEQTARGANRIADHVIGPGQSREFELEPNCYDVRAVTITDEEVYFLDLTLMGGTVLILRIIDG